MSREVCLFSTSHFTLFDSAWVPSLACLILGYLVPLSGCVDPTVLGSLRDPSVVLSMPVPYKVAPLAS